MCRPLLWALLIASVALQVKTQRNRGAEKLQLVSVWNDLEYEFPNRTERQNAINQGNYISRAGIPIDVDVNYRGLDDL